MVTQVSFSSVTDSTLRLILESDYREIQSSLQEQNWKSAIVLSGSVVEALLVDYLTTEDQTGKTFEAMVLAELVTAASEREIIDQRLVDMTSVVRSYRNLIHPGKVKRNAEEVNEDAATIACSLLSLIAKRLAELKIASHGYTAAALIRKFETDSSAPHIAGRLVSELSNPELRDLICLSLPERIAEIESNNDSEEYDTAALSRLKNLFYSAFSISPPELQVEFSKIYLQVLIEATGDRVNLYESTFFCSELLNFYKDDDLKTVKEHLLGRFTSGYVSVEELSRLEGLGFHIDGEQTWNFYQIFFRTLTYSKEDRTARAVADWIVVEYETYVAETFKAALKQLAKSWVDLAVERDLSPGKRRLEELYEKLSEEDPF